MFLITVSCCEDSVRLCLALLLPQKHLNGLNSSTPHRGGVGQREKTRDGAKRERTREGTEGKEENRYFTVSKPELLTNDPFICCDLHKVGHERPPLVIHLPRAVSYLWTSWHSRNTGAPGSLIWSKRVVDD